MFLLLQGSLIFTIWFIFVNSRLSFVCKDHPDSQYDSSSWLLVCLLLQRITHVHNLIPLCDFSFVFCYKGLPSFTIWFHFIDSRITFATKLITVFQSVLYSSQIWRSELSSSSLKPVSGNSDCDGLFLFQFNIRPKNEKKKITVAHSAAIWFLNEAGYHGYLASLLTLVLSFSLSPLLQPINNVVTTTELPKIKRVKEVLIEIVWLSFSLWCSVGSLRNCRLISRSQRQLGSYIKLVRLVSVNPNHHPNILTL